MRLFLGSAHSLSRSGISRWIRDWNQGIPHYHCVQLHDDSVGGYTPIGKSRPWRMRAR